MYGKKQFELSVKKYGFKETSKRWKDRSELISKKLTGTKRTNEQKLKISVHKF